MFTTRHPISLDFRSPRQRQVNEPTSAVSRVHADLGRACRLAEAPRAQNTRAGSDRTYYLVEGVLP
jgi:hypothetical protein